MTNNFYLVWLEWPEACFRVCPDDIRYLKTLIPPGGKVMRVRSEKAFLSALPRATHAIVWRFEKEWFPLARNLKVLATPGAGRELVEYRDVPAGVIVHFGGYHGAIIAESVVAFMLAWVRGFFKVLARRRRIWPREWLGNELRLLAGTRAVIVGYGKIGKAIGARLSAFGVAVEGFGRANIALLGRAVRSADWLIMALPSDTGTDNLLDCRLLAKLPRRAVVINVGRGNSIDEEALRGALESGRIAGAYLDVFKNEPTALARPTVSSAAVRRIGGCDRHGSRPLWDGACQNLVAMPHCSAFSPDYIKRCFKELKDAGLV